jgi:hypothetical protein
MTRISDLPMDLWYVIAIKVKIMISRVNRGVIADKARSGSKEQGRLENIPYITLSHIRGSFEQ